MSTDTVPRWRVETRRRDTGSIETVAQFGEKSTALDNFLEHLDACRKFYRPDGPYRLLLLGPDHITLPADGAQR